MNDSNALYAQVSSLLDNGTVCITVGLVKALNSPMAPIFMVMHRRQGENELDFFCGDVPCADLTIKGCRLPLDERPFECAAIVPNTTGCGLPNGLWMEDLWAPYQTILRTIIEERSKRTWLDELNRQLEEKRNISTLQRNAQKLIQQHGLATTPSEISLIAGLAKSLD
ncbi:MAG: hypothetical protein LBK67_09800 [Coriobacteriales bacterium]|nr:hypothetical protein [Coriobacteriales bacterium]